MDDVLPEVVYHYTSAATLLKIVESQSIWATNLQYLNDITESTHCIHALQRRIDKFLARNPSEYESALRSALDVEDRTLVPPYVASFSTVQDSLPMWRSYCPNGNGVSIGFKISALQKSALTSDPLDPTPLHLSSVRPVEYLDFSDYELQDRILRDCLDQLEKHHKSEDYVSPNDGNLLSSYDDKLLLRWEIVDRSCLVKHGGFKNEQEIRLIAPSLFFSAASLKFRCPRSTVIPYLELFMPRNSTSPVGHMLGMASDYFIESVTVGPTPNPHLTTKAIQLLFESRQVNDVLIFQSDIPYRDL